MSLASSHSPKTFIQELCTHVFISNTLVDSLVSSVLFTSLACFWTVVGNPLKIKSPGGTVV